MAVLRDTAGHGGEEDGLAVGGAGAGGVEVVGDQRLDPAPHLLPAADLAVVHEEEAAVGEGVAVGAGGCGAGGGADVGEEGAAADLGGEAAEVFVGPGGADFAVEAGGVALAVPAEAEAVAVGFGLALGGVQRLVDQAVARGGDKGFEQDGLALVGEEAAHDGTPCTGTASG